MLFPLRIFNSQEKIRLDDREQKVTWKNVKSVHIERKSNFAFILIRRQLHQNDKFKLKKTRTNAHEMLIKHIDGTKNGVAFFFSYVGSLIAMYLFCAIQMGTCYLAFVGCRHRCRCHVWRIQNIVMIMNVAFFITISKWHT